jgi:DNA-binding winged helix-turn-helix (wHTH) protein
MHTFPAGRVRFAAFELDLSTGELRTLEAPDPNHKVLLREQVFQVLRMLLEHEGRIVTREEIKATLWPDDTVVDFDRSINATIKTLRRALGDSADSPRYIETLARRGYRLMEIELVPYDFMRANLYPIAYHALGREKESDTALKELIAKYHAINPYLIAHIYAFRNQPDEAFEWLERAYAQRDDDLYATKVDPLLKNLHGDPRFAALLKKLNLPT